MTTPPKRGAMTPARMRRIWERERGICWWCDKPVPMRGGAVVRYDHRIPFEISFDDRDENIFPIHRDPCDLAKTAADQGDIAKARRRRLKAEGVETRKKKPIPGQGFQKGKSAPIPSRGFSSGKTKWPKRSLRK